MNHLNYKTGNRHILWDSKKSVGMDWTPKAGCTVATKMFFEHMGLLEEALNYHPWIHRFRANIFYDKYAQNINPEHIKHKFKVVRNPYDRAISIYLYSIEVYNNPHSFSKFLEFLLTGKANSKAENDRSDYMFFHAQLQTKPADDQFIIVKLENIGPIMSRLNSEWVTTFNPNHTSSHHFQNKITSTDVKCVANEKINIEAVPPYRLFYNGKTKHLVEQIYRQDLESYKYEFPYIRSFL